MEEIYPVTKEIEDEQQEKRAKISRAYLDGRYEECLALVIDAMATLSDSFIQPHEHDKPKQTNASMFSISRQPAAQGKTRFMHKCTRQADCDCSPLLVFYFSLLHLTEQT